MSSDQQSPKRRGRPRKSEEKLPSLEDLHRMTLRVAQRKIPVKTPDGRTATATIFEANVLNLASGSPKNRLASKSFVELANQAASYIDVREAARRRSGR